MSECKKYSKFLEVPLYRIVTYMLLYAKTAAKFQTHNHIIRKLRNIYQVSSTIKAPNFIFCDARTKQ